MGLQERAALVRRRRKDRGLTIKDLATEVDVTARTISRIELAEGDVVSMTIARVCRALEIKGEDLAVALG